jgi:hypothetical protein
MSESKRAKLSFAARNAVTKKGSNLGHIEIGLSVKGDSGGHSEHIQWQENVKRVNSSCSQGKDADPHSTKLKSPSTCHVNRKVDDENGGGGSTNSEYAWVWKPTNTIDIADTTEILYNSEDDEFDSDNSKLSPGNFDDDQLSTAESTTGVQQQRVLTKSRQHKSKLRKKREESALAAAREAKTILMKAYGTEEPSALTLLRALVLGLTESLLSLVAASPADIDCGIVHGNNVGKLLRSFSNAAAHDGVKSSSKPCQTLSISHGQLLKAVELTAHNRST